MDERQIRIVVIGTGYVGLVSGTCLAELGHSVICVDTDRQKIDNLRKGILPIYEPGLETMVQENTSAGRLAFTSSLSEIDIEKDNDKIAVYFIAVGTPPKEDGSADLQYVLDVAEDIGKNINQYSVIVNKSTVPVSTAEKVKEAISRNLKKREINIEYDVVSNPEFLKEGAAIEDFMKPDRVIIGSESEKANHIMLAVYEPFMRNHNRIQFMGLRDAEMTKYVANAMLATKISFMNEIAVLCEKLGVDVENVRLGIGSDIRIGYHFIYPGCGYGGSCFPKDVKALISMARKSQFEASLLEAVERRNGLQKHLLFEKIYNHFDGNLTGKSFAVWGLSFKPGTDDVREASSITLINDLLNAGASVRCFDPVAVEQAKKEFDEIAINDGRLIFGDEQYEILDNAAALVLVTEWKPFRRPDFSRIGTLLDNKLIFDGRNQYDPEYLQQTGFTYYGIGRKSG